MRKSRHVTTENSLRTMLGYLLLAIFILLAGYHFWGARSASPESVAAMQKKVQVARFSGCHISESSEWTLRNYPYPEYFIQTRMDAKEPIYETELWMLDEVIASCERQANQRKESQRIAALQKSALK